MGFKFYDLFFPDCTAPPFEIVERFLEIVESTDGAVAVHCFAGMGRTGTLIACYMIKHLDFNAAEATAWCRLCRYGSIIGIQYKFLERHESVLKLMGLQYRKQHHYKTNCEFGRPICGGKHRGDSSTSPSASTQRLSANKTMATMSTVSTNTPAATTTSTTNTENNLYNL